MLLSKAIPVLCSAALIHRGVDAAGEAAGKGKKTVESGRRRIRRKISSNNAEETKLNEDDGYWERFLQITMDSVPPSPSPDCSLTKLLSNDGAEGDWFGVDVAIDGDTILVGSDYDDDNGSRSGAVYVFQNTGMKWEQQAKLVPDDGQKFDFFGTRVALSGDTAVIGAPGDDDNGFKAGAAYVWARLDGIWQQEAKLLPNDANITQAAFGLDVAIDSESSTIIIGAPGRLEEHAQEFGGFAYVYEKKDGRWEQQAKLAPNDRPPANETEVGDNDRFGFSLDLDKDTAVIGANKDDDDGRNSGSVYIFTRDLDGAWTQQTKIVPSDVSAYDWFGYSVAIENDTVVVGSTADDILVGQGLRIRDNGSVYVYGKEDNAWTQEAKLVPQDGTREKFFGRSVAIDGGTIVVGANGDDENGKRSGSVYIFERKETWEQTKIIPNDGNSGHFFGQSVAIDSSSIAIGAPQDDDNGVGSGSVYNLESINCVN